MSDRVQGAGNPFAWKRCGHPTLPEKQEDCYVCMKLQIRAYEKNYDTLKASQAPLERELMAANRLNREYLDQIEWAWSIIASAGPQGCIGNWEKMDKNWVPAAERWRDKWHEILRERAAERQQTEKRKCVACGQETGPGDPRCMQCLHECPNCVMVDGKHKPQCRFA